MSEEINTLPDNLQNQDDIEKSQNHIQEIIDAIRNIENPKKSVWKNLLYLLISVILFISLGLLNNPVLDIAILVGVILFHELGHYVAMTSFGYKDVKMFFIPFFGAAVSGKPQNISGAKKAIVALSGPVPGIILGVFLIIVAGASGNILISQISIWLLFINGFNLLPIFPFDGGRFLFDVVFSRQKYVEATFKVLAVVVLIVGAIYIQEWLLGLIAFIVIGTVKSGFTIRSLAEELSEEKKFLGFNGLLDLPREQLEMIITKVLNAFPNLAGKKVYANYTVQLWDRITNIPPSLGQAIALVMIYIITLSIIVFLLFFPA
jgi:Zn-dependent protease